MPSNTPRPPLIYAFYVKSVMTMTTMAAPILPQQAGRNNGCRWVMSMSWSDTGDFGRETFGTNRADRLVGCQRVTVDHGTADGGQKALGVVFIAGLP